MFSLTLYVKKIVLLCLTCLVCVTLLTGCGTERLSRLELEIYRVTAKIERLESKIDMLRGATPLPLTENSEFKTGLSKEQMEKLIVDLKAQISCLKAQLAKSESHLPNNDI